MLPDQIETLRQEYTDKYVAIDSPRPELARFQGLVGQVKTVNMSGRALVQFETNNDRGWYDIAVADLKVVDKPPPPKPVEKKAPATKPKAPAAKTPEKKTPEKPAE